MMVSTICDCHGVSPCPAAKAPVDLGRSTPRGAPAGDAGEKAHEANTNSRPDAACGLAALGESAPAGAPPPAGAGAAQVTLSPTVATWLAIVAAHERVTADEMLARLILRRAGAIGLGTALDLMDAMRDGSAKKDSGDDSEEHW